MSLRSPTTASASRCSARTKAVSTRTWVPFPHCRIGCTVRLTGLTVRRAHCGRGCAAERRAECCPVGDAAGYVDALTGEGLGIAFGAAQLLVECVAADRPQDYDRRWRRMSRRYRLLTAAVLQATASPLRSRIVPAAAQFPGAFTRLVNLLAE